jgi:hypothetical protein
MKTIEQIAEEKLSQLPAHLKHTVVNWPIEIDTMVYIAMREYAKEVLRDYDNWKAHKTPELVERYINEKGI